MNFLVIGYFDEMYTSKTHLRCFFVIALCYCHRTVVAIWIDVFFLAILCCVKSLSYVSFWWCYFYGHV